MTKRSIATGLLAVLLVLLAPAVAPAAPPGPAPARTVVLLLAPYLRWDDVLSGNMPETRALAESGAVGNMNVRSLLPDAGPSTPDGGALMLSAGTWARFDPSGSPPSDASGTPAVVFPGLSVQTRANAREDAYIRLGTLGVTIERGGGWTAAIGNADGRRLSRPAALVAMDASGTVRYGDVSTATVTTAGSEDGPSGVVSDAARIQVVLAEVLRRGRGPGLVVIDPGDLSRSHDAANGAADGLERTDRLNALAAFDALAGTLPNHLPEDALLIIAAPVAAEVEGEPPGFGPLILDGAGWSGSLTSGSTHRRGLVTNADLTATILTALGMRVPGEVAGSAIATTPAAEDPEERIVALARVDAFMRSVDAARPSVIGGFILAAVLLVAASAAIVVVRPPWSVLPHAGQIALLGLLSLPVASLLMYVVVYLPQTPGLVTALLLATTAIVWTADTATHHAGTGPRALSVLALLTVAVIVADQWLGAWLSLDGLLSYSPLVGARFYGLGNEGAALLVGGALTGCAMLFDTYADQGWIEKAHAWGFPALAVLCVVTAAAPMLGANIGVAVWGTFAFALAWWGMRGRRIGVRAVLVTLLVVILAVAAFAALDLTASGSQTHLGRTIVSAGEGGLAPIWTLVQRKAATNVRLSLQSAWSALALVLVGALAYVRVRPRGTLHDLMIERPRLAAAVTASLVAALVSYFTEDSGVIVPALLLLFPAIAVVYLMLGSETTRAVRRT